MVPILYLEFFSSIFNTIKSFFQSTGNKHHCSNSKFDNIEQQKLNQPTEKIKIFAITPLNNSIRCTQIFITQVGLIKHYVTDYLNDNCKSYKIEGCFKEFQTHSHLIKLVKTHFNTEYPEIDSFNNQNNKKSCNHKDCKDIEFDTLELANHIKQNHISSP
ncbi:hypothetical protein ACTFIY_000481 [Dictyostelium cf. discoideum]